MIWEKHVRRAEAVLGSSRLPGAEEIISLIKRVNPTSLQLSEADRETGYRLKDSLQNLLLENYGENFRLVPHPYSDDILLIRHRFNPTIDACHTHIRVLSIKALDTIDDASRIQVPATTKPSPKKKQKQAKSGTHAREALAIAQRQLVEYDYSGAEETLAAIRVRDRNELAPLIKAVRILVEEMGTYESAAATILAQPEDVQADRQVRELLALTCYGRDMIPEARALFENLRPDTLGKSALFACADVSFRDGNLSAALSFLKLAEAKEGILPAETELRNKIEQRMRAEAEPLLLQARPALAAGDLDQAEALIRQALARYPHYPEGRCLLREIEARRTEGEIKALWLEYESSASPQERLKPLAKLQGLDSISADRVRALIEKEKGVLKLQSVEQRLCELRTLAAAEEWSGCFDILMWLSHEGEAGRLEEACAVAPLFSVLQGNRKLMKLPDEEAKEIWLSFVAVKAQLSTGMRRGCLERLEKIKPYFCGYADFDEEYAGLLETERELARSAASDLMRRMFQAGSLAEARTYAARLRRVTTKLPAEEAARSREYRDMTLNYHSYRNHTEEDKLEDYRTALLLGNAARAAALKDSIEDREKLASIDREIADYFAIEIEPVTVIVSPDADLDLATKPRVPLILVGESLLHKLFREDDETILVINVVKGTAARYRSPNFKDLGFLDSIPDRDLFLFANAETSNHVWRAKLSETEARFLAEIVINENFTYEGNPSFRGMLMSSSKDNDYYAVITEGENIRVVRQSLDVVSTTVRTFHAKGEVTCVSRGSCRPDTMFLGTDTGTFLLNSNLDLPPGQSRAARTIPMQTFAVDCEKLQVYIREGAVKLLNSKLRIIKQYPNSVAGGLISRAGVQALCTETDVALISLTEGMGTFYNLNTNKFSQTIALERMMWTDTPTRWHAYDYDKDASTLLLWDITHRLDTLLEWRIICTVDEDDDTQVAKVRQFEDPDFFSLPPRTPVQGDADSEPAPEESHGEPAKAST
ncbi:hypothetical protein E4633_02905 [Geomonas terrae]|uniref:Tetratricopeptide repeat protein n=1 Tax=Geomonas terrae TaxID=2562681 RepID=A0A4S1CL46_9BACT|nr:hypothetical protein [Geomonas terrae]TGU74429.1 hypothetical protein E4633_02905 [Geomonas terrae]